MDKVNSSPAKGNALNFLYPLIILTIFVFSFLPAMKILAERWSGGDNNYCYLIIPLFLYLCWEKRESFRFFEFSWSYTGLLVVLPSVLLILAGEISSTRAIIFIGFWGVAAGLGILLYGKRVIDLAFPFIILLFIVPLPPYVNRVLTFKMKMIASFSGVELLRAAGYVALLDGNVIDLGVSRMQVVDACSGMRYFMPMLIMALLIGHFEARIWWKRLVLFALVVPVAVSLNALRIFVTGILIQNGHKALTEGALHDSLGLILTVAAGIIFYAAALLMSKMKKDPPEEEKGRRANSRSVKGVRPIVLTLVVCVLFAAGGWAFKGIPAMNDTPARKVFASFPMQLDKWRGTKHTFSDEIIKGLGSEDYLSATFIRKQPSSEIYVLIPFYELQGTNNAAHAPQSCLLGGGWVFNDIEKRQVRVGDNNTIELMSMKAQKGKNKVLSSYFFLQRGRVFTSPWVNKWYLFWDAVTMRRTDGALVRVEIPVPLGGDFHDAYQTLGEFLPILWEELPEYVPF